MDCAAVIIRKRHFSIILFSDYVRFDSKYADQARQQTPTDYPFFSTGFSTTVGKLIQNEFANTPHDNWQSSPRFGGISREIIIQETIIRAFKTFNLTKINF